MASSKKTPTIYHLVRAIPPDALPQMTTIDETLQTLVRSLENAREINERLELAETIVQTLEGLDVVSNAQISDCIPSLSVSIISVVESYNGDEDTKSNLLAAGRIAVELHELRCETSDIAVKWLQNSLWSFHERGTRVTDAVELSTSLEAYLDIVKDYCQSDKDELIHSEADIEKLVERTVAYLQFLQYVVLHMEKNTWAEKDFMGDMVRKNMLEALAVFAALGQQAISKIAADILGKVLPAAAEKANVSQLARDLIYHLVQNDHFEVAISLWLRWVDMPSPIGPSSHLSEEAYWTSIQTALTSGTPAIRKMLLYIIGKSLRLIDHSFNAGIFSWDASRSRELLAAWDKYTTLTDMIGIQCSPNQFGDALPEFSKLLDGGSKTIHGSWIGILFSMAFRSTSGGLQRHAYNFIFSLPEEKQYFFEEAEGFLCGEFLSFMLGSQHLQQEIGKDDTCQHGVNLARFLQKFISQTQNRQYVADILDLIHDRGDHMFVPTRLYLLDGISRGVSSSKTRILNLEDMRKIVRNTGYRQIAKMRKHIVLLLYLDLLSGVSLENTTTEEKLEFLNAIAWIIQDSDSRRIFTLDIAIKLLRKVHPEKKPWLKTLVKNRKLKEQEFDEPKQVLLKALLTGSNADSSLMSYFAYLLFGPKMIRMVTSQNILGLPEESLCKFRTSLLIKVFGESEAAPASISLVRGGNKSSEAQRDFDELLGTFTYSQFRALPVADMQVLAKLEARGNGFRQIVKDMDGAPLRDMLFPLFEVQSLVEEHRDRTLEIVKRTSAILELRGNMLQSGLTKASEDEPALIDLLERIEVPRSQSNDAINAENFSVYGTLLTSVYTNLHLQIQAYWRNLHHNRRFRQHCLGLPTLLSRFMDCIRRQQRFLEGPAILPVLDFIGLFVEKIKIPDEHYDDYDDGEPHMNYEWIEECRVGEYLKECWDSLEQFRGRVEQGVVIKKLIEITFSASMIEASYIPSIQTLTKEIADDILRLSVGRLGLLATFAKQLHKVATLSPIRVSRYFHDREDLADVVFQIVGFDFNYSPDPLLERPLASDILHHRLAPPDVDSADMFENYYEHKDVKAFVYIFDLISQLDVTDSSERRFAKWIRERVLRLWTEKNRKGMFVHIKQRKTRHLQALLMLERLVDERDKAYVDTVMQCLAEEGHPRFRFMFEWILSLAIGRENGFALKIQQALAQEDTAKKANPKYQTSLLAIAVRSASLINIDHRAEYYEQLITTIMSYAIHSKVVIRHQAITGILQICNEISALLAIYSALNNVGAVTHGSERIMIQKELFARAHKLHHLRSNPLLEALYRSIKSSQYYKENTRTMEDQITFNPQEECTMSGIFEGEYLEGGDYVEVIPVELWDTLPPTMEGRSRFVDIGTETDYNNEFDSDSDSDSDEEAHPHDTTPASDPKPERRQLIPFTKSEAAALDPTTAPSIAGPLQTKSRSDPNAIISPPTPTLPTPTSPSSDPILILVASHVTSPPNLGGICRLSEIFGVRILYLSDPSIVSSKDFTSVSVSSEVWLPIQGLSADAETQREFYKRMRREGFTIVGVEQTDGSVVLGKEGWQFPRRCVLVLGSEKEGMPPEVLAEMDVCVEIRQRGETRSLNVQVAAGVVVAEFNRQWGL